MVFDAEYYMKPFVGKVYFKKNYLKHIKIALLILKA